MSVTAGHRTGSLRNCRGVPLADWRSAVAGQAMECGANCAFGSRGRGWRRSGRWVVLAALFLLRGVAFGAEPLDHLSAIHLIPPEESRKDREFSVEATVTYGNLNWPICFLQDATAGFYVHLDFRRWNLTSGDRVRARGRLREDGLPEVSELTLLERNAAMPAPETPALSEIARGENDSVRVKVTGWPVNRRIQNRHHLIDLVGEFGERFRALLPEESVAAETVESWLGGRMELTGVCGFEFSPSGDRTGFRIWVPSPAHVDVETLDFASPLNRTVRPVSDIYTQGFDQDHPRAFRVEGVVSLQTGPRLFYLQDPSGGVLVRTEKPVQLRRGRRITVLGAAAQGAYSPFLNHARVTATPGPELEEIGPAAIGAAELLAGGHDAELVSVEGRVLTAFREADQCGWVLEAEQTLFMALLPASASNRLSQAAPGSTLRVSGVCEVKVDQAREPRAFSVRLGGLEDFAIADALPWWTLERLLVLLGCLAGVAGAGLAWGVTLRRRVAAQTRRIEEQYALIRASEERHRSVTESINEGILITDLGDVIQEVNPQMLNLTGYSRGELLGRRAMEVFVQPAEREGIIRHNRRRADGESERYEQRLLRKDGSELWVLVIASPLRDARGAIVGTVGVNLDITGQRLADEALRKSLAEKETLLREVHHRVKNNLQVISSLLYFEQKKDLPPGIAADLRQCQSRIAAIALVHERLYESGDLGRIQLDAYLRCLTAQMLHGTAPERGRITVEVSGDPFTLGINEAVPCALIINELLANSLKHAFPGGRSGKVRIELGADPSGARTVTFCDDGVGLGAGEAQGTGRTLGLRLVHRLIDQLQGRLEHVDQDCGTCFRITLAKME